MNKNNLRPISEELVNKIINQDATPASYGCGSISLSVSDNFGTHEIKVDSQSFSCQILEK